MSFFSQIFFAFTIHIENIYIYTRRKDLDLSRKLVTKVMGICLQNKVYNLDMSTTFIVERYFDVIIAFQQLKLQNGDYLDGYTTTLKSL